eukprot:gene17357-5398_t
MLAEYHRSGSGTSALYRLEIHSANMTINLRTHYSSLDEYSPSVDGPLQPTKLSPGATTDLVRRLYSAERLSDQNLVWEYENNLSITERSPVCASVLGMDLDVMPALTFTPGPFQRAPNIPSPSPRPLQ